MNNNNNKQIILYKDEIIRSLKAHLSEIQQKYAQKCQNEADFQDKQMGGWQELEQKIEIEEKKYLELQKKLCFNEN